jgi:hypothetical protein
MSDTSRRAITSGIRYGWIIISQGNSLSGFLSTKTPPSDYLFVHEFMAAAEAQAEHGKKPFDSFNSNILIALDKPNA